MQKAQEKFILNKLNTYRSCKIKEKYTDYLEKVSTPAAKHILNQKYVNGCDMKALLCLFDTVFLSATKGQAKERGLYNLTNSVQKWITNMENLDISTNQSYVYTSDIFSKDINVIIKIPQYHNEYPTLLREYFIGIKAINKLRYLIPTFVYTLGAFLCPKPNKKGKIIDTGQKTRKTAFVVYEKIEGQTLSHLLRHDKIDFNQWLVAFVQILLSLEVAQREIRFTHFDLHGGNIMIRNVDTLNYSIPLDNTTYNIANPKVMPVIIDFGYSSAFIDKRYIGSYDHPNYGMLNFMVQGYDMYKLLIFSLEYSTGKTKNKIQQLFKFYGDKDPYKIMSSKNVPKTVSKALDRYTELATYSDVATYTPLMFVKWIFAQKQYKRILDPYVVIKVREEFLPIKYSHTIQEYEDIFNHSDEGRKKALQMANDCLQLQPSYVMSRYTILVLEKYNKQLQNKNLSDKISALNKSVNLYDQLILIDLAMLEKVFDIKVPDQSNIDSIATNIIKIPIRHTKASNKQDEVKKLDIFVYQEQIIPYLQYYFTIKELNLENVYSKWMDRFKSSDIFKSYNANIIKAERSIRWGQTLLASINI